MSAGWHIQLGSFVLRLELRLEEVPSSDVSPTNGKSAPLKETLSIPR